MKTTITIAAFLGAASLLIAPGIAQAQQPAPDEAETGRLNVSLGVGLVFPQIQSELGTSGGVQLGVGYRVWKQLVPFAGVGYSQPGVDNTRSDPRLPADYMTATTQRELMLSAGGFWRFLPASSSINAYAGLAARVWLLESRTNGEAGGETFLENEETSTRYGGAVFGGGEYRVGPGAVMLELDIGGSDLPHLVTGDVTTTAISLFAGYRLLLL
ncbi:MAG TPA: outer membrane beta-barrel protein [Kofleriaceae bacterium]|nr:outer membrane beta-barrel protein [Kofleriaceae bacterium]